MIPDKNHGFHNNNWEDENNDFSSPDDDNSSYYEEIARRYSEGYYEEYDPDEEEDYIDEDEYEDEEEYDVEDDCCEYYYDSNNYIYSIDQAIDQVVRTETGEYNTDIISPRDIHIFFPIIISPVNKYIKYPEYPYSESLLIKLLDDGCNVELAINLMMRFRVIDYINDYIRKDENGVEVDFPDIEEDVQDEYYPDIYTPYWYINIKK